MRSTSDPIRSAVLLFRGVLLAGAVGLVVVGMWAMRPLDRASLERPRIAPESGADAAGEVRRLAEITPARLWNPPPRPAVAAKPEADATPPPPPPPPLQPCRLQLLAIVRSPDPEVLRAALYDPETDTIAFVTRGEAIGARTVESISGQSVELRDGKAMHRLVLEPDAPGGRS